MKGTGAQTRPSDKVRCTLGGDWSHLVKLAAALRLGLGSIRRYGELARRTGRVLPSPDSYSACLFDDSFDWSYDL
jgi:hypothetical protein